MPPRTSSTLKGGRVSSPAAQVVWPPQQPSTPSAVNTVTSAPARSGNGRSDAELHQLRDALDHIAHASLAGLTGGLSPAAIAAAFMDWAVHLAISPGKQAELAAKGDRKSVV